MRELQKESEESESAQKVFPLNYFSAGVSSSLDLGEVCSPTREQTTYDGRLKKVSKV